MHYPVGFLGLLGVVEPIQTAEIPGYSPDALELHALSCTSHAKYLADRMMSS